MEAYSPVHLINRIITGPHNNLNMHHKPMLPDYYSPQYINNLELWCEIDNMRLIGCKICLVDLNGHHCNFDVFQNCQCLYFIPYIITSRAGRGRMKMIFYCLAIQGYSNPSWTASSDSLMLICLTNLLPLLLQMTRKVK